MRQISILTKLELANIFSLNVIRHTKDKKAKKTSIALGITIGIVILMLMFYCGAMSYGYIKLGVDSIVPVYIVLLTSIFTLIFCAFKAGKIIFKDSCYDIMTSMPISKAALVISRYIRLYVEGLVVAAIVMLPGIAVYAYFVKPGVLAILLGILSIAMVPVIPVTVSVLLGVVLTGISSRLKNKAVFEGLFAVAFVVLIFLGTGSMPVTENGNLDISAIENVATEAIDTIEKIYPPSGWFAESLRSGEIGSFILGTVVSLVLLIAVVAVTILNFHSINRGLHTTLAKHNYKLGELQNKSLMKALVLREAKRYFSSGTYIMNTIMGPVMAVAFAISLFFVDMKEVFPQLPIALNINGGISILFAAILVMNSPIATSVSMEGKEFWIIRTLPVADNTVLKSKLLFSLFLLAPFYVVGEVLMMIALKPTITEFIWMIILPAVLVVCVLVIGLAVNLKFPKLKWDSDVEVVKQSASALIGGLGGMLVVLVCAVPVILAPVKYYNLVACGICIIVTLVTLWVNDKNNRFDMKTLC